MGVYIRRTSIKSSVMCIKNRNCGSETNSGATVEYKVDIKSPVRFARKKFCVLRPSVTKTTTTCGRWWEKQRNEEQRDRHDGRELRFSSTFIQLKTVSFMYLQKNNNFAHHLHWLLEEKRKKKTSEPISVTDSHAHTSTCAPGEPDPLLTQDTYTHRALRMHKSFV